MQGAVFVLNCSALFRTVCQKNVKMSISKNKNLQKSRSPQTDAGLTIEDAPERPIISIMPGRMETLLASAGTRPLTADETAAADRAVRRLHEHSRAFLAALPAEARNASGLARFLNVDRTTCQRLVYIATRPYGGLTQVDRMPGVRGLRQLIDAARAKGRKSRVEKEPLDAFEAAVDRFEAALRDLGGSQSALLRRISATPLGASLPTPTISHTAVDAQRKLFDAAAELTGRSSEVWLAVYVYSPLEQPAKMPGSMISVARAHGLIGHVARPDAVPLTFHNFTSKRADDAASDENAIQPFHSLNDDADGNDAAANVLREFSTDPPPVVSSRQPGEYLVQAIDQDPATVGGQIDLMFGTRSIMPHPGLTPPRIEEVWAMINFPARRIVFDVYMHRDLARTCIPSLDLHLWRPDFAANIGDRWQTRFANGPRLELLGPGAANAHTRAYERHADLTNFLFRKLALDPQRFIGYRCAADYPVWRAGYCMSFDFNAGEESE